MSRYNAKETEEKWQRRWAEAGCFAVREDPAREKYYVLEMFPYPSGKIHMGHVRNYTIGDVVARYKRAKGFNVLHPMGWDAFGLPAENAAMERGVHPATWTYENIATMRGQLKLMGLSLDWDREIATCHPGYYAHQQRLFVEMLEKGLVYRKESSVNWDPVDQTVLANEQVIDGKGWRSGALIERRKLSQWFFKITALSDELLSALDGLDRWPEKVRLMQRKWIGRSEGATLRFRIEGLGESQDDRLTVFTPRPDTLLAASFRPLPANHPPALAPAAHASSAAALVSRRPPDGVHDTTGPAVRRFLLRARRQPPAGRRAGGERSFGGGLRRRVQPPRHQRRSDSDRREAGFRHRPEGPASLPAGREAAGLYRQLRADGVWQRRHLRLPGARPARSRLRPQVRPAGHPGRAAARCRSGDLRDRRRGLSGRRRHDLQFRLPRWPGCGRGQARSGRPPGRPGRRRRQGPIPPARLGYLASALLGLSDPRRPLRRQIGRAHV